MKKKDAINISKSILSFKLLYIIGLILLQSCYSVRISSRDGIPKNRKLPKPEEAIFYKDKPYTSVDTTIKLKVLNTDFTLYDEGTCPNGFYSIEYRVSLGNALLNLLTFGKVKRVKIKYVCIK